MIEKNKLTVASSILILSSLTCSSYATSLEIRSNYEGRPKPCYIRVKDSHGNSVRFNSTSKGYVQSNNGTDILSPNTDNNYVLISDIKPGNYNLEGVTLDNRYIVPQSQSVSVSEDRDYQSTLNLYDNTGNLKIKVLDDANSPISGARFEIEGLKFNKASNAYVYNKGGSPSITSDMYGTINLLGVPAGTYNIYQSAMKDYTNPYNSTITVGYNQTSSVTVVNPIKKAQEKSSDSSSSSQPGHQALQQAPQTQSSTPINNNSSKGILKLSAKSDVFLSGFKFKIIKGTNPVKFSKSGDGFKEDSSGTITEIESSKSGPVSISLDPSTYKLSEVSTPAGFSKIKDKEFEIKKGVETKITVKKKLEKGNLKIELKNESQINIKGFGFKLKKGNEELKFKKDGESYIYDPDGAVVELETNDNGEIDIKGVPVGEFKIENTKAISKYEKISENVSVKITKDSDTTTKLLATKERNIIEVLNNNDPLANVKYKLFLEDTFIKSGETGIDGDIGPLTENGDYYVEIESVPEKYSKPKKKFKFTVKDKVIVNSSNALNIDSSMIKAKIGIKKKGVEFALFKDGKEFMKEKTDDEGVATFVSIPYGEYTLKDTSKNTDKSIREYKIKVDENYSNKEAYDFSKDFKENSKVIKELDLVIGLISLIVLSLFGYTAYNVKKIMDKNKMTLKEACEYILKGKKREIFVDENEEKIDNEKDQAEEEIKLDLKEKVRKKL